MKPAIGVCGMAVLWVLLTGCGQAQTSASPQSGASPQPAAQPPAAASEPVATVDGTPITRADLDALIAPQLAKLDEQAHQLRRQQLDELIGDRLLDAEARRRNIDRAALEKAEIASKVTPVTEAEIATFVQANRARLPPDPSPLMPQIRQYLAEQRETERRDAFLEELRKKSKVEVLLKPPPVFRALIDLAGTPARGPDSAKVTVVEFSDFHCPYCKRVQPTLTQLLAKYPKDVRLVYKHMPLDQLHPQARRAAEASWCAQQQGKFWEYHDVLYAGGPDGSDQALTTVATRIGLNLPAYQQCMSAGQASAEVQKQVEEGAKYGVQGTPGFFVNGRFINGAVPLETFVRIVDEELAR